MISLHVYRLYINLLIKFGIKTNERNSTISKFIRYLCFVVAVFIHSCYHRLKMRGFSLKKKIHFGQSIWPAGDQRSTQPLCLRFWKILNTSSWKDFWSKGDSSHFENSPSFQISWTWSDAFRINENVIQQLSGMLISMFISRDAWQKWRA